MQISIRKLLLSIDNHLTLKINVAKPKNNEENKLKGKHLQQKMVHYQTFQERSIPSMQYNKQLSKLLCTPLYFVLTSQIYNENLHKATFHL